MRQRYSLIVTVLLFCLPFVFATEHDEGDDPALLGLELEKLLNLSSGMLALVLSSLAYVAYRRTRLARLKYVCFAFLLFAIKGFLTAHELFIAELPWIDPFASVLNVAILLVFFFGIVKR